MSAEPVVFVVDDDEAVRHFLKGLISSVGLEVKTYASAQDFLGAYDPSQPGCLLLDLRMPGMSGLELQEKLVERGATLPIIFLTGHGSVQVAVHAMHAGAVDFIEKPFNNELLLDRIQKAVTEFTQTDKRRTMHEEVTKCFSLLTPRERQVFELVVAGQTNKGVARDLGISEKTVEIHRRNVMEKMQANSLATLVKMAAAIEIG